MNTELTYRSEKQIRGLALKLHAKVWGIAFLLFLGWTCAFLGAVRVENHPWQGGSYDMAVNTVYCLLISLSLAMPIWILSNLERMLQCTTFVAKGSDCVELAKLMDDHPEVANFIARVNRERGVLKCDLFMVKEWLAAEQMRQEEAACKRVHGIARV